MTETTAPSIRRQLVGGALRRYREAFGASLADAAEVLRLVIAEAALHQAVGTAAVMRQQAACLAALAESAQVDLRVVPFGGMIHPAPDLGALSILRFGENVRGGSAVYLPGAAAGQFLTGSDASPYLRAWEELRDVALSVEESCALLRKLALV
jgi:hypothetical protein